MSLKGCKCSGFMLAEDLHCPNYWWFISISVKRKTAYVAEQCLTLRCFPFVDDLVLGLDRSLLFLDV